MSVKKKQQKQKKADGFWNRHVLFRNWLLGILAALALVIIATFIWFRVSPWPGAMLIRWEFEQNGAKTWKALEKHAPKSGIVVTSDQQYLPDDKDALLDVYVPQSVVDAKKKLPVIIWTHGGAWLSGDKTNPASYFKLLAQAGYAVVAPDYSLAPDSTYPTAVRQLNASYVYLEKNADRLHVDMNKVVLAGDSAGSQLSAQLAALVTNPDYAREVGIEPGLRPEQLKGVVLTCGIYKMEELARPSRDISKIVLWGDNVTGWAYSGTRDFSQPVIRQMSPYYHVTKDFPPVFITGGNGDPLTDGQSKPLADKLQSLGVDVTRLFYAVDHAPSLPHEYQFNLDTSDGQGALGQITDFVRMRTE
jgi:acetyl esterase